MPEAAEKTRNLDLTALDFWDHALTIRRLRADSFGQFVRLIGRRTLARPRAINSAQELQTILEQEGVRTSTAEADRIWKEFTRYRHSEWAASKRGSDA